MISLLGKLPFVWYNRDIHGHRLHKRWNPWTSMKSECSPAEFTATYTWWCTIVLMTDIPMVTACIFGKERNFTWRAHTVRQRCSRWLWLSRLYQTNGNFPSKLITWEHGYINYVQTNAGNGMRIIPLWNLGNFGHHRRGTTFFAIIFSAF